jgi:hypothetical protein
VYGSAVLVSWAEAYQSHGKRTDQFRKTAARTRRLRSVMMALPFWKKRPPRAGSNARPSGTLCQWDGSWSNVPWSLARGRSRSSVEVLSDRCVSEKLSENKELLLRLRGMPPAAEAAERLGGGLIRRPPGRGLAGRSSLTGGGNVMLGARSAAMLNGSRDNICVFP